MIWTLTEDDARTLRDLVDRERRRPARTYQRPDVPDEQGGAPEVYMAFTPPDGIPHLTSDTIIGTGTGTGTLGDLNTPGVAECNVYNRIGVDLRPVDGLTRTVYNVSSQAVPGNEWVPIVRDKYGTWFAVSPYVSPPEPLTLVWAEGFLSGYTGPLTGTPIAVGASVVPPEAGRYRITINLGVVVNSEVTMPGFVMAVLADTAFGPGADMLMVMTTVVGMGSPGGIIAYQYSITYTDYLGVAIYDVYASYGGTIPAPDGDVYIAAASSMFFSIPNMVVSIELLRLGDFP